MAYIRGLLSHWLFGSMHPSATNRLMREFGCSPIAGQAKRETDMTFGDAKKLAGLTNAQR